MYPTVKEFSEDRIRCDQCKNLAQTGRCKASKTPYTPLPDLLRRCIDFNPLERLQDRRNGRMKWPELIVEKPAIDESYERGKDGQ